MGGVDPEEALATYWAAGARGMCFVEYLIDTGALPAVGAYFLFAPVKVKGSHGGHGRALAIF
jgi:kynurenine formamidase